MFCLRKQLNIGIWCTGVFLAIVCSLWSKPLWSESCGGHCDVKAHRCPSECSACVSSGRRLDRFVGVCQESSSAGIQTMGQIYEANKQETIKGMFSGNHRYMCTVGEGLDNTYHIQQGYVFDNCYKFFCNGTMLDMKEVAMAFCTQQQEVCPKPAYLLCTKRNYPLVCSYEYCSVSEETGKVEWKAAIVEQNYEAQRQCKRACPELYKAQERAFAHPSPQDNRETCAPEGWHCTEEDRSYWDPIADRRHEYTCLYTVCANGYKADEKGSQSGRCPTQCTTVEKIQYSQQ